MAILPVLKALPFVGRAVSFVTDKTRLAVEYLLIAVAIAIAAWSLTLYIKQQKAERVAKKMQIALQESQNRLTIQELINAQQQGTIGFLQDQRKKDSEAITGIVIDLKKSRALDTAARNKLHALEKQNEKVRNYLDSDLPAELECVLNEDCGSASASNQVRKSKAPSRIVEGL